MTSHRDRSILPDSEHVLLEGVKHVCFDKDGTLIDVHAYWDHIARLRAAALRRTFGLGLSADEELLRAIGIEPGTGKIRIGGPVGYAPRPVIVESVRARLAALGVAAAADRIGAVFAEVDARQQATGDYRVRLLPGAADFVSYLVRRGLTVSVYSSDRAANVKKVLDSLPIGSFFRVHVGGDSVAKPKPDPEGFLLACRQAGALPGESIYVGDTVDDLKMGAAGGARRVIGVATGLDTLENLSAHAELSCASLAELAATAS